MPVPPRPLPVQELGVGEQVSLAGEVVEIVRIVGDRVVVVYPDGHRAAAPLDAVSRV